MLSLGLLLSVALLEGGPGSEVARASDCSVVWGQYQTDAPWSWDGITSADTAANRHSSIVQWYAQWGDSSGDINTNLPLLRGAAQYSSVGVTGAMPMITWEPWGPPFVQSQAANAYPLRDIGAGRFDSYVDSWASGLKSYGGPVMVRFAHEMNGDWYPWGARVNGNTANDYIGAFRHVVDRFRALGAANVLWVWTPDGNDGSGSWPAMRLFYPGDGYVDWVGADVYNTGTTQPGSTWQGPSVVRLSYDELQAISPKKPIVLAEWASAESGGDKAAWIRAAAALLPQMTAIKALVWFNEKGTEWALDSSPAAASATAAFGAAPYCGTSSSLMAATSPPPSPGPGTAVGVCAPGFWFRCQPASGARVG